MYIQTINKQSVLHSYGNVVYRNRVALVHVPGVILRTTWFSLLQRLLREKIHQVIIVENKLVVLTKGYLRIYDSYGKPLAEFAISRGSRPLRQGLESVGNVIFYGDYWNNSKREPVNLYRIDLNTFNKQIITEFNHIRHIHCVHLDSRDNRYLYIGTGDSDSESGIYRIDISTGRQETIVEGAQCFRAVSLIQNNDDLLWGSDSPSSQNAIYRLNLLDQKPIDKIIDIEGPAYYSTKSADGSLYISTAIEDRRYHKAIIYRSIDNGLSWHKHRSFNKDFWSEKWFGYGVIEFPRGQENISDLCYNLCGLKET